MRRKFLPQETLVEISPEEYSELTKETIIDCNNCFIRPLSEIDEKLKNKEIRNHDDLPEQILEKIIAGLHASPMIAEDIKEML